MEYARAEKAVLFFDAAYEGYISDPGIPRSIYEIDGAREVAVEMRSFSKSAGFTGLRCAFTVVPKELRAFSAAGEGHSLHAAWVRRHNTKFNGVSYPVQRGAAASYSPEGRRATAETISFYMENARLMKERLSACGYAVYGGENAPYLWIATPEGTDSWGFFDLLLEEAHVVGTPGSGFGAAGEGYLRLSAFQHREAVEEALTRIAAL